MTDSELIKALENSINTYNEKGVYVDTENLQQQVLDLINSQKEEIERLKSQCENTQIGYNFLKSDFERLKGSTIVNNIMEIQRIKRDAQAEAYKEFAEIIKDKWFDNRYDSPDVDFDDFIDNVLKELVGDNK